MSDDYNPWSRPPAEPPKHPVSRHLLWWVLILAGIAGIGLLWRMFPNALSTPAAQGSFIRLSVLMVLVASGIVYSRRFNARETIRNIALWAGIVAALVLGYTFYHQFQGEKVNLRSELVPGYPTQAGDGKIVLSENSDGAFAVIGSVNGTPVQFMIDTGASDIVLSPDDAKRAGIDADALRYAGGIETANGEGRGAPYTVDKLEVGPIKLLNVPVTINGAKMRNSLLGMAFLRRMKSFEMSGRELTLRYR
jgi:aspartyl protease family protein